MEKIVLIYSKLNVGSFRNKFPFFFAIKNKLKVFKNMFFSFSHIQASIHSNFNGNLCKFSLRCTSFFTHKSLLTLFCLSYCL